MYPVLFTIPYIHLPIHSYGVMLGISIVAGWFLTLQPGKRHIPDAQLKRLIAISAISALAGARMLAILTTWSSLDWRHPLTLLIPGHTGLVAYGGFLGGFLGAYLYTRRHRLSLPAFADAASPSLALGLFIARIGCFLYGCDYGRPIPASAPNWIKAMGVQFPNWQHRFHDHPWFLSHAALQRGAPAFVHQLHDGLIPADALLSLPVYPAQLIASLNGLVLLLLLLLMRHKCRYKGQLFLFFTMYYGVTRTLIEWLRGDSGRGEFLLLTTSQWVGIATFTVALIFHIRLLRTKESNT